MSIFVEATARVPSKFLRTLILGVAGLAALTFGGCTIRPTQEDVTHVPTTEIVRHIRCEARLAILDKALQLLRSFPDARHPDPRAVKVAADLEEKRGQPLRFDVAALSFDKRLSDFYEHYVRAAIGYEFTFNITETNNVSAGADPIRLITNGIVGIGITAKNDRTRQNTRRFSITDGFGELLADDKLHCAPYYLPDNAIYPIAGSVGLEEVVHTFIDLDRSRELERDKVGTRFGDTLIFTTTFSGTVAPRLQLTPLGNRWGVQPPANVGLTASRTDVHQLLLGLSIREPALPPNKPKKDGAKVGEKKDGARIRSMFGGALSPGRGSESSGNKATVRDILEEQRIKDFLDRGAIIAPR